MNIEEKAKAYDEALAKCKAYIEDTKKRWSEEFCKATEKVFEEIFPQLAESYNERIRKAILIYLDWLDGRKGCQPKGDYTIRDMIVYLEKQKDSKWSPSEDEMGVLYKLCYISNQVTDWDDTELTRLYQDLKREYFNGRSFENMFPSEKQKEHQSCPDAPKEKSVDGVFYSSDKDKNLDEIAQDYVDSVKQYNQEPTWDLMQTAVCYGYHLSEEQFEKNRLANCDAVSKEECDRETDFAMEIIEKEHRQPIFNDAINYGMRLQKQKEQKPNRERNKPKESWLSKAKYEIEHADELLIQRQEELRKIRELKKQEQKPICNIASDDAIESCMLRYLQSAANRKDDVEIIEDTKNYKSELISIIEKEQKPAFEDNFKWTSQDERCRSTLIEILELADIKYPVTKDSRDELWEWLKELPMKFPNKNAFIVGTLNNDDKLSPTEEILGIDGNPTCHKQKLVPKYKVGDIMRTKQEATEGIIDGCR